MSIYDFTVKGTDGNDFSLTEYKGKVLLVVNTATGCGFTPQYTDLQALYAKYNERGFEVLDFPCNQFLNQAPGTDAEIGTFCSVNFNTTFPRFKKIKVNGADADSLYKWLKDQKGGRIKWNFTKFLVNRDGEVVQRYASAVKPADIDGDIEQLL